MAFSITLSTAATKSAYQRFGDAYIAALTQAVPELDMAKCQSILSDVIGTVGRKAPKEKKAPKAKKSPKAASPSKRDLKKVELIGELKSYGEFAGEIPDVASVTIGAIRKQITAAKKAQKAAAKAAKAAKEAKKSPKAKKAKKAKAAPGPSKRDLKKAELLTELTTLGGSLEEGKTLADYSVTDLRKMIKEVTPKKKKGRKAKKKAAEADHEALLATLASSLKAAENEPAAAAAPAEKPKVTQEWVEPECTIASVTTFTGGANGEVIATKMTPNAAAAPAVEEDKLESDSSSDEEEESELELDSDSDSDSDDE